MRERLQDRPLLAWGAGLLALSLVVSLAGGLLLPRLLSSTTLSQGPFEGGVLSALAVVNWLQQASLVLGAALVAAHALLRQLVPLPDRAAEPDVDWYG